MNHDHDHDDNHDHNQNMTTKSQITAELIADVTQRMMAARESAESHITLAGKSSSLERAAAFALKAAQDYQTAATLAGVRLELLGKGGK